MTFAAAYEDVPGPWGVGRVVVGDTITPWPVSEADIDDETASMTAHLAALGLHEGGLVLIVSLLSQMIHVNPFERAASRLGALYSSADRTPFDAFRTAALIRQLQPAIVMGIDGRVLDGLSDAGRDVADVFGPVPVVLTVDGRATTRFQAARLEPLRWVTLGPTSAVQHPGDDELTYDAERWQVTESNGELHITNLADRLTPCVDFTTGIHGSVVTPGRITLAD
jgi:hypothetical protein